MIYDNRELDAAYAMLDELNEAIAVEEDHRHWEAHLHMKDNLIAEIEAYENGDDEEDDDEGRIAIDVE